MEDLKNKTAAEVQEEIRECQEKDSGVLLDGFFYREGHEFYEVALQVLAARRVHNNK
jgi:hypothetical protein